MLKRKIKKIMALVCLTLVSGALLFIACNNTNTGNSGKSEGGKTMPDISQLTSKEITHLMTAGWNLGNTMDAHMDGRAYKVITAPKDQETLWGNPVTTKAMIDKVKATGFNTVRIPVTWYMFTGSDYTINDTWMNRVQEVVDYVINNGMFCILNTHHDDYKYAKFDDADQGECGWLRLYYIDKSGIRRPLTTSEKTEINERMKRIWEQIAGRFKNYSEYLIFEGVNEPRTIGLENITRPEWDEQAGFLNVLLQTFVDTVRAAGGKNSVRHLMVSPYFASVGMDPNDGEGRITAFVNRTSRKLRINDPQNRLIVSLHYYEPWGFAVAPSDSQWFSAVYDLSVPSVSSNVDNTIKVIDDNFIKLGIPVIMGEAGAIHRMMPDGSTNEAERVKWANHYAAKLKELGVPVVIWDDGGSFKLLDRARVAWLYPDLAAALVEAAKTPIKK
jgi:endoglucanase